METLDVPTRSRTHFVDITRDVQAAAQRLGITDGLVTVFVPHTTAGVTISWPVPEARTGASSGWSRAGCCVTTPWGACGGCFAVSAGCRPRNSASTPWAGTIPGG